MDPLRLNLEAQTQKLLRQVARDSSYWTVLQNASRPALLDTLSALLRVPQLTAAISTCFRPIILDLCARWLHRAEEDRLDKFEALCLLLEVHPELYPVLLEFLRVPGIERGPLCSFASTALSTVEALTLHRILLAYYRILQANRTLPRLLGWPLTPLSQLIWSSHPNNGVRLLAIRCYALQVGMMEGERVKIEKEVLGDVSEVDCSIAYGVNQDGTVRMVDGWVLPVIELERVTRARDALLLPQEYFIPDDDSREPIHPAELSPMIANVHGILMLRSSIPTHLSSTMINTPTAVQALRQIALHLSMQLPTLLTSAPSAGKSLLISHLAEIVHPNARNHIVTIHLADTSLDPRSLLGSYISSPTRPGTFEWKEGVLVRAMREGKWVVLEDIDRATMEVLGIIKPLVESLGADKWIGGRARLDVPSRGVVEAEDSFALFATRSLQPSRTGVFSAPTFFGAHKFYEVAVGSPTASDLRLIVDTKFPRLAGAPAKGLITMWEGVRALGSPASTRDVGLRELEKLCMRTANLLPASLQSMDVDEDLSQPTSLSQVFTNPTIREDIFLEARDVLFGSGATTASGRAHLDAIARVVAGHLGLSDERRDWILQSRTPEFDVEKDVNGRISAVRAGRIRLPAHAVKADIAPTITRPFAMHRPAVSLFARLASAISLSEPVLLTGETGTGKTSVVTHLASLLRRPLISLNLSNQTESSDILGGFKPVDARIPGGELQERFLELFGGTFSRKKNAHFEESVRKAVQERKWKRAAGLWLEAVRLAKDRIKARQAEDAGKELEGGTSRKRRKVDAVLNVSSESWEAFERDVQTFEVQHVQGKSKFAFAFVEGPLVKALRSGDWILLDEVNLATPETLESISGLLHGPTTSITLTEQGSLEPIPRHPDFRLFACMNPATDIGKKDLPPNIRSRFTEIDVPPPDADKDTLLTIIAQYIGACAVGDKGAIMDVAEFYTAVKRLAEERQIADGSNHRPHFSMRTLARALTFASDMATTYSLRRALWEGCLMAFTMALDGVSATAVTALAQKHILAGVRNPRSLLMKEPLAPGDSSAFIKFGPFYLERGPLPEDPAEDYIMTPSVETKLIDLARIIAAKRFPVLIEGPTSSGKTSSIEYLAKRTGHRFVRINNHEHTDIQEYVGTYVSDPVTGKLVFKEGLLVRALRQGDWIVLDELNLAPTDVLEALNRLLDDNRELVIPETQEVVRPHPHFMLFATQNPPGLYAGRKVLSRAFRNRFLEVHFEDVPQAELETILCQRCRIAPSYGQRIVCVFRELQKRRQTSRVFESKHGFATLRDLFRWAGRDAMSYEELAANGYMLLAERARRDDDKAVVKEVIESIMKVRIDESSLYDLRNPKFDLGAFLGCPLPSSSQVVWTAAMQRLFVLTARALRFNEPVLLVGETGCGKTSVCQLYAEVLNRTLRTVNCHQNTETADLIGGLRPIRNKAAAEAETLRDAASVLSRLGVSGITEDATSLTTTIDGLLKSGSLSSDQVAVLHDLRGRLQRFSALFEWRDGPLVEAMRNGDVFLLDEISLADDSVLERLNSVLETGRTIVLAEQGGNDAEIPAIRAADDFKLVATMNPGGDYGKKELSPALRNRFTEIWVPPITDRKDLECIVATLWQHDALRPFTAPVLDFVEWLCSVVGDPSFANLRDILAWVSFSNAAMKNDGVSALTPGEIFHHAAQMTFLDGLGSMPQLSAYSREALERLKLDAVARLQDLVPVPEDASDRAVLSSDSSSLRIGIFSIPRGPRESSSQSFSLEAPTTRDNVMRVVRACQLPKPIMLEGSPGVGKTSLVAALANMCGYHLCRINLSDQTDLVDLFGSDLPVEGGEPGQFAWKDAEFLRALQEGHWVLLDEMNLAPQSVLEGLNAVLDHRGTVYIPELGRSFIRHPSFRIFAAQNPLHQGGGRKGLPKSFLNRFTKVYVQEMGPNDLLLICRNLFPKFPAYLLQRMIAYMAVLNEEAMVKRSFAREGAPWEFNLRDVIRWATLLHRTDPPAHPREYLSSVILQRFRTPDDRERAHELFSNLFSGGLRVDRPPAFVAPTHLQIGHHHSQRIGRLSSQRNGGLLQTSLSALESLGVCIENGWLAILTGPRNSGKTALVRTMASLLGRTLREVSINNATDATDVLGSFEETDLGYCVSDVIRDVVSLMDDISSSDFGSRLHATTDRLTMLQSYTQVASIPSLAGVVNDLTEVLNAVADLPEPYRSRVTRAQSGVRELSARRIQAARLEWVDGPLVRALKEGHWLLLDGANLCNPSVLDRLNSLCEIGGSLVLNERGAVNGEVQILLPHPEFRLFMCADAQYGELSRAMRNRGIEIALTSSFDSQDLHRLAEHLRCSSGVLKDGLDLRHLVSQHALLQRGLGEHFSTQPDGMPLSAGRLLLEDSSNAVVANLGPEVIAPSGATAGDRATYYFLAGHVIPIALSHLSRYISYSDSPSALPLRTLHTYLGTLECSHLYRTIIQMRKDFSQTSSMPPDATLAQPLYANMANPTVIEDFDEASILRYLRLFVAITIDYGEPLSQDDRTSETVHTSARARLQQQAATHINLLVDAVKKAAGTLLDTSVTLGSNCKVRRLLEVVAYGRFLSRAVQASGAFDFSLAIATFDMIKHSVAEHPSELIEVVSSVKAVENVIALKSGFSLIEIWKALSSNVSLVDSHLVELEAIDRRVPFAKNDQKLRTQVLDLMSMWKLSLNTEEGQMSTLEELTSQLKTRLLGWGTADDNVEKQVDFTYIFAQLQALATVSSTESRLVVQDLVDYGCANPGVSLTTLIPYRQLLWISDARESVIPGFMHAQRQWLSQMWDAIPVAGLSGPSSLLHPAELSTSVLICDKSLRPLATLPLHEQVLRQRLSLFSSRLINATDRFSQTAGLLAETALMIAAVVEPRRPPWLSHSPSVSQALAVLDSLESPQFSVSYREMLRSSLQSLSTSEGKQRFATQGRCWIALSRLLFALYVPNVPIDPSAVRQCVNRFWSEQRALYEAELVLQREHERKTFGRQDNVPIRYLLAALEDVRQRAPLETDGGPSRSDVVRLHTYWTEVSQFLEQVVSISKVDGVISALENREASALMREQVLQESTAAFSQRLDSAYGEFADISMPIQLALLQLRLGLRMIADTNGAPEMDYADDALVAEAVVAFPSVKGLQMLDGASLQQSLNTTFSFTLWRLAGVALEAASGVELPSSIPRVELIYEQSLRLWMIDKARKEEVERQEQSLYRHKTELNGPATEAELEEQEFLALFPEYADLLEEPTTTSDTQSSRRPADLISPLDVKRLSIFHQDLFGAGSNSASASSAGEELARLRKAIVHDILVAQARNHSEALDQHSRPYQISLLLEQQEKLRGVSRVSSLPSNFYADPNVPEVRKSSEVLGRMVTRLTTLIAEWPDQMVLQHLKDRADAILRLDTFSPVAKVLSAVEQLLLQMEDWEMYANRENTLKSYQHELASLVVSWRRLELTSWQGLLRTQAQDFAEGASEWWFRLYEATIRGVTAASQEAEDNADAVAVYLEGLVPLLDSFMTSSPLGQFSARLQHLRAFEVYCLQLGARSPSFLRVHRILHSTGLYYAQFLPRVTASLSSQQQALEKEIRDFIKLASWKDINVHALKQSAQRTHRQLYKCVRKFREILRQPVTPHLVPTQAGTEEASSAPSLAVFRLSGNTPSLPPFPVPASQPDHLQQLDRTFKNFRGLIQSRICEVISALTSSDLEDLSAEIIATLRSLASATAPGNASKEQREKFQKALLVRKRKAWSDLLKELKRVGLAMNVKPEVLEQQSNPRWLREQPHLIEPKGDLGPFDKSEVYFLRLTKLLPDLRAALGNHHPDLGARDLQRGTNLVESAFSFAVDTRASFVEAVERYLQLQASVSRLHKIGAEPRVVASGPDVLHRVISIKEDVGRLVHALGETATIWQQYLQALPSTASLPEALEEFQAARTSTQVVFSTLADVAAKMRMMAMPLLLESEAAAVQQALDHIGTVVQLLRRWAGGPNIVVHFVRPLLEWTEQSGAFKFTQFVHELNEDSTDTSGELIDRLLLCVQGILSFSSPPSNTNPDVSETPDRFIREYTRLIGQLTRALKVDEVHSLLTSMASDAVRARQDELETRLARTLPFLDAYLELVRVQLTNHCAWTKALFKLDYVICSVMHSLAKDGFCKPPEADEGEAGEAGLEDAGGMGLGEGAGSENVSKEIEDESQVEGLQGEAGDDEDVERAEEGNALEMSEDFGGKMQDVPDKEGEDEEGENNDEDGEEPEEQVGDLDAADPSAVDEKLWGDESGPEELNDDGGKPAEDHSTKQQEQESETVAKEDDGKKSSKEKDKAKEQKQEQEAAQEGKDGEGEDKGEEEVEEGEGQEMEEGEPDQQGGAPLDDFVPEAETLDLPDDMEFGKEDGKEPQLDDDIEMDDEEGGEEEDRPGEDMVQDAEEEDVMDTQGDNPQEMPEDGAPPDGSTEDMVDATAAPDLHAGAGQDSGQAGDQPMADANRGEGGQGSSGEAGGPEESVERAEDLADTSVQENQPSDQTAEPSASANEALEEGQDGTGSARSRQGAAPSQAKPQPLQSNPLRSIGDALREISQRIDEILESEGAQGGREQQADTSGTSQMEYLRPEDDKGKDEMQALGPAQQEDVAKLNDLKFLDEEMEDVSAVPPVDESSEATPEHTSQPQQSVFHSEHTAQTVGEDVKSALTQTEIRSQQPGSSMADPTQLLPSDRPLPSDETEHNAQEAAELALRQWQAQGQPEQGAEAVWRKYEALTHDLSYALCEQLRLILEPTMATRLKGDYRTGKRLNMKKIIPYIASEFTKDKIWLRRTRPSQREYQVLIALDDSRSMAESHSVHLAFQTLALVSKALGKLEVGDIAIAKFGEAVDVLHGFDGGPFTDQAGTKVMSAFHFDQKATQVLSLVETSLKLLEQARERRAVSSASAGDLWQLEIIISDGICQDHDRLRTVLRQAEEQRVMVVFIVLDSLHSKSAGSGAAGKNENSILSMNQVAYKMVDGRMDLQVERYLDTFPFEYYVVLRNVEALPDVLSGTLKQFFERIAES